MSIEVDGALKHAFGIARNFCKQAGINYDDEYESAANFAVAVAIKRYDPSKGAFRDFLSVLVVRSCLKVLGQASRRPESLPDDVDILYEDPDPTVEEIEQAVEGSTYADVLREVITGSLQEDIAARMGVTDRCVRKRLSKGRKEVAAALCL